MVSQGKVDVFYFSLDSLTSTNGMAHSLLGALQICAGDRPIEQAKHCLSKVINYSVIILDDVQDIILANENTFLKFLECMALSVPRVKLIIMSCQVMDYLFVDMVSVLQDLLSLVDVKELLVALDSGQLAEESEKLAHHCGGVPVVLRTTAAVLAKGSSTKTLRSTFQTSPVSMLKSFNLSKLSSKLQPFYCLGICFSRLKPDRQAALVSSAVFPRILSEGDAQLPLSH